MEFRERVVVITGGTAGIGEAIARRFVEAGARVAIIGRNDDAGRKVEAELRLLAGRVGAGGCRYVHADVANGNHVRKAVADIVEKWHSIGVLVNNAAVMATGPLIDMDEAEWEQTVAVNMRGPFLMAKHAMPHMPPDSSIINMSSVHARYRSAQHCVFGKQRLAGSVHAWPRARMLRTADPGQRAASGRSRYRDAVE